MTALHICIILLSLLVAYLYLGKYIFKSLTEKRDWRIESFFYKLCKLNTRASHGWKLYTYLIISFSCISILFSYIIQRIQSHLLYSGNHPSVDSYSAINTAVSFVTNTNWQSYIPETTLGISVTMLALIVQQFISPAIGIVVAVFLSSSIASSKQNYFTRNFYRDITRIISRILVPYSFLLSIAFATLGIINNFRSKISFHGLSGSKYDIPSGPAAALEAIKNIGTNGGGFYNANSAHPFSNPNLWSNSLQIIAFLSIPIALIAVYGHFIGDMKHAHSIAASVLSIALLSTVIATYFESKGYHNLSPNLEGKELRFGNFWSTFYGSLTTLTSNGGVNASHDSFLPLSGFFFLFNIFLGEIAPGGAGSGLYGIIVIAILANFIFGLMLGKLPSYRKKKIGGFEISMASLYILVTPLVFFIFTIINLAFRRVDQLGINTGAHGLTELFYAYASTSGNNGSAFAGFASSDHLMQTLTTFAMFFGRYLPIVIVMALAGSFYKKDVKVGDSSGLPSHGLIFSFNFTLTILVITAITYIPFLLLGPIVDLVS